MEIRRMTDLADSTVPKVAVNSKKEAVLKYLDLIAVFWANPDTVQPYRRKGNEEKAQLLSKWKQEIRNGKIPDDRKWR